MKEVMKEGKYSKLNLVEVVYGDDEPQKSTDQTQALLSKYPDLKVICAQPPLGSMQPQRFFRMKNPKSS